MYKEKEDSKRERGGVNDGKEIDKARDRKKRESKREREREGERGEEERKRECVDRMKIARER